MTASLETENPPDANFVSLMAPEVVVMTTTGAASDDNVDTMTALGFQCVHVWRTIYNGHTHQKQKSGEHICNTPWATF